MKDEYSLFLVIICLVYMYFVTAKADSFSVITAPSAVQLEEPIQTSR
jgi:hypothetical protein